MTHFVLSLGLLLGWIAGQTVGVERPRVGLYRLFEAKIENGKSYTNKFLKAYRRIVIRVTP